MKDVSGLVLTYGSRLVENCDQSYLYCIFDDSFSLYLEMALTENSFYDNNVSVHDPEILELTEDNIAVKFASGLANAASLSLSISYPSIAAAPCMFNNAYKNVLALSVATDYTYRLQAG